MLHYSRLKLFLKYINNVSKTTISQITSFILGVLLIFNWQCTTRKLDRPCSDNKKNKKDISIINKKAGNDKRSKLKIRKCKKKQHKNTCNKNNIKTDIINTQVMKKVIFDNTQNSKNQQKQDIKNEAVNLFLTNSELDKGIDAEIKTDTHSLQNEMFCPAETITDGLINQTPSIKKRVLKTPSFIDKNSFKIDKKLSHNKRGSSPKNDKIAFSTPAFSEEINNSYKTKYNKNEPSIDAFIKKASSTQNNEKQNSKIFSSNFKEVTNDSDIEKNTKAILSQRANFHSNQNTKSCIYDNKEQNCKAVPKSFRERVDRNKFMTSQNLIDENLKACKSNNNLYMDGFATKAPSLFSSVSDDKKSNTNIEKKLQPIKYHERLYGFLIKILEKSIPEIILKQEIDCSNMSYKQCLLEIAKSEKLKAAFFIPIMIITLLDKEKPYKEPRFYNRRKYLNAFLEYSKNDSEINKKLKRKYKTIMKKLGICEKIASHNVYNAHKTILKQFEYDIDTFRKYFNLIKSKNSDKLLLQHYKICNEATLILLRASLLKELFKESIGIQEKYVDLLKFTNSIINYRGRKIKNFLPKINKSKFEKEYSKKLKSRIKILKLIKKHTN